MTGGEPFYDIDRLKVFIDLAANHGLTVGAISSAFWAKTLATATGVLAQLPALSLLTVSADAYHSEFVPRSFVKNAYFAAQNRGLRTRVRVSVRLPHTNEDDELLSYIRGFCSDDAIETQQVIPYGRAAQHPEFNNQEFVKHSYCPALGPHILNNGEIIPCCNAIVPLRGKHPLHIGDGHDNKPLSESVLDNILFVTLKVWGVDSIAEYLYGAVDE
jgi:hypothetical protein